MSKLHIDTKDFLYGEKELSTKLPENLNSKKLT